VARGLEETLGFENQVSEQGKLNFIVYAQDIVQGNNWALSTTFEIIGMRPDTSACAIRCHFRGTKNGQTVRESDSSISLRRGREIAVLPLDQRWKPIDTAKGHPQLGTRTDPPVFAVVARRSSFPTHSKFYDESLANRVAKAMIRGNESFFVPLALRTMRWFAVLKCRREQVKQ
jgi:hypothetical protein